MSDYFAFYIRGYDDMIRKRTVFQFPRICNLVCQTSSDEKLSNFWRANLYISKETDSVYRFTLSQAAKKLDFNMQLNSTGIQLKNIQKEDVIPLYLEPCILEGMFYSIQYSYGNQIILKSESKTLFFLSDWDLHVLLNI